MLKEVHIEAAVGKVLGHDLTQIIPGEFKGRAFKKGHIISRADIPKLLNIGKEHIYVLELTQGQVHEDDAATRIATALSGPGTEFGEPSEGKVDIRATHNGLFKVHKNVIYDITACSELSVATIHNNSPVRQGQKLAGARVVPLIVEERLVRSVEAAAQEKEAILQVLPFQHHTIGIVTTGSEVFTRRIEDRFTPVVLQKLTHYPSSVLRHVIVNDHKDSIRKAISSMHESGVNMIFVTGGMSVDPDDRTPAAIRDTGAEIITYGTPVLPGSMLMLAYLNGVPVIGLPGCVMYNKTTVFDLILPRLFARELLSRRDFTEMAIGGLCAGCNDCRYPECRFGKN